MSKARRRRPHLLLPAHRVRKGTYSSLFIKSYFYFLFFIFFSCQLSKKCAYRVTTLYVFFSFPAFRQSLSLDCQMLAVHWHSARQSQTFSGTRWCLVKWTDRFEDLLARHQSLFTCLHEGKTFIFFFANGRSAVSQIVRVRFQIFLFLFLGKLKSRELAGSLRNPFNFQPQFADILELKCLWNASEMLRLQQNCLWHYSAALESSFLSVWGDGAGCRWSTSCRSSCLNLQTVVWKQHD